MNTKKLTIAELASLTRNDRQAVKLPGVVSSTLSESADRVMSELLYWDSAENILAALKVEA